MQDKNNLNNKNTLLEPWEIEDEFERFCFKTLKMSAHQFRNLKGMSEERFVLLKKEQKAFGELLSLGFSVAQIVQVDHSRLVKLLNHADGLNEILRFVTVSQLLGFSHTPTTLTYGLGFVPSRSTMPPKIQEGDFLFEYFQTATVVTYKPGTTEALKMKIGCGDVDSKNVEDLNVQKEKSEANHFFNNWFKLSSRINNNQKLNYYYCSEKQAYMAEILDLKFPIEELRNSPQSRLLPNSMYAEQYFVNLLKERGWSVEQLIKVHQMSYKKIDAFARNPIVFESLLDKGLTSTDIAKVEDRRLIALVGSYHLMETLLEFVSPQELLGLKRANSLGFYKSEALKLDESNEGHSSGFSCL